MKVVTINSNRDIFVYGTDYTQNKVTDSSNMNLNSTTWLNTKILIHQGIAEYPAEIAEWKTIKCLEKAKVLTVSAPHEGTVRDEDEKAVQAKEQADIWQKQEAAINKRKKDVKDRLEELADLAIQKQVQEVSKGLDNGKQQN